MIRRVLAAALLAPAAAGIAAAAGPPILRERVALSRAGQAAARAEVVARADLGAGSWRGGATRPGSLDAAPPCPGWLPRRSDLVVVGRAESRWSTASVQLVSGADVLATRRMAQLEWRRIVVAPQLLACMRSAYAATAAPVFGKLVSLGRVRIARIGDASALYRIVAQPRGRGASGRILIDTLAIESGRSELLLATTAPWTERASVEGLELRLGRLLAARA